MEFVKFLFLLHACLAQLDPLSRYLTTEEILNQFLPQIVSQNQDVATFFTLGMSEEGRKISAVEIDGSASQGYGNEIFKTYAKIIVPEKNLWSTKQLVVPKMQIIGTKIFRRKFFQQKRFQGFRR